MVFAYRYRTHGGVLTSALLLVCLLIIGVGWLAWQAGVLQFTAPDACVNVADVIPGEQNADVEVCLSDE